ncbi:MAG: response regulator [Lentimonas sp.]
MKKIYILCVDDEPEVLDAVQRNIADIEDTFPIITAESADDARKVIEQIKSEGNDLGLILCDHVMPGDHGVDLLIEIGNQPEFTQTRKVLLTGQAGLDATVKAVNKGQLNHYIAKPWGAEELMQIVKDQLTEYIIKTNQNPIPYMAMLDAAKLSEYIYKNGILSDE